MFNIMPIIFFGWAYLRLGLISNSKVSGWGDLLTAVVPPFSVFGIYRVWIAIVELSPSYFYYKDEIEQRQLRPDLVNADPTLALLPLGGKRWYLNLIFGLGFIFIGSVFVICH
jgi:hypothetical protein